MELIMTKVMYWCSKELEPKYSNCSTCEYGCSLHDKCSCRHSFHADAVRECDMKRRVKGIPLISEDFDLMKENFRQKELVEKTHPISALSRSEQMKLEALERVKKEKHSNNTSDFESVLRNIGIAFLIGFPAAYLFQICQIITEFLFGVTDTFLGNYDYSLETNKAFYSSFWERYLYCVSLISMLSVWAEGKTSDENVKMLQYVVTAFFIIMSVLCPNLFISIIIGPLFIVFGLLFTAKRR